MDDTTLELFGDEARLMRALKTPLVRVASRKRAQYPMNSWGWDEHGPFCVSQSHRLTIGQRIALAKIKAARSVPNG